MIHWMLYNSLAALVAILYIGNIRGEFGFALATILLLIAAFLIVKDYARMRQ